MKRISFILLLSISMFGNYIFAQSFENTPNKSEGKDLLLKAYPNPAYDALLIEHDYMTDTPYQIYSIEGSVVQKGLLQEQFSLLNIKTLPEGMYIFYAEGKTIRIIKVNPQ